jgi:hypothetical protein
MMMTKINSDVHQEYLLTLTNGNSEIPRSLKVSGGIQILLLLVLGLYDLSKN